MSIATIKQREQDALKGRLILDWLLFPARLNLVERRALLAAAKESRLGTVPEPLTALFAPPDAGLEEINTRRAFAQSIEEAHLLRVDQAMAREDVQAILSEIAAPLPRRQRHACHGLIELLRQLIKFFGIDIYVENRSVSVALNSLRGWYEVTDRFDAEGLLCVRLADLGFAREISELDRWSLVTLVTDRDLDALLSEGVSDMHQHLGGLRSAHIIWLQLMAGQVEAEQIPYFGGRTLASLEHDPETLNRRIAERDRIKRLASAHYDGCDGMLRRYFFEPLGQLRYSFFPQSEQASCLHRDWRAIGQLVAQERVMLARGFARLIELEDTVHDINRQTEARRIEHALDLYITAKSHFISNHRQAIRSNPGLGRHRQFAETTRLWWGWEARPSPPRSAEVRSYDYSEAVYYLFQSPILRRAELRLGPAEMPQDYTRFLESWSLVESRLLRENSVHAATLIPKIRFSIHFKRSLDRRSGSCDEDRMRTFLQELDAQSAALHEFRLDMFADQFGGEHAQPIVARIARIDLAGQERDLFPDRAAFAMNLLRGDEEALTLLNGASACPQPSRLFHSRWQELKDKNRLHAPVRLPRLGVTCHAGEDYAHPLEGIHAMMTSIDALKMRAGDSISHGLAIGRDVESFHREVAQQVTTTTGAQFDALAWLQATLLAHAPQSHMQAVARIEAWLWRKVMEIYPRRVQPLSLTTFVEVARLRRGPVPEQHGSHTKILAGQIWWHECWNPDVQEARRSCEPIADILYEIEPSIAWAQEHVAREISRRGVVIEFNPSSNWRISQARRPQEIPFVAVLMRFGSFAVACINTDNAGAYGTRIENEYAIALFGLMEAGLSRTEAITLLDRLRLTGLNRLH